MEGDRGSPRRPTTIDRESVAVDHRGFIAGQEIDRVRYFFGFSEPTEPYYRRPGLRIHLGLASTSFPKSSPSVLVRARAAMVVLPVLKGRYAACGGFGSTFRLLDLRRFAISKTDLRYA